MGAGWRWSNEGQWGIYVIVSKIKIKLKKISDQKEKLISKISWKIT